MTNKARVGIGIALVAAFAAAAIAFVPAAPLEVPPVVQLEEGNLRFTYHVMTGTRGVFDLAADPKCLRNLAAERPEDARRMEEALERKWSVKDLSELQNARREDIRRWHENGYF